MVNSEEILESVARLAWSLCVNGTPSAKRGFSWMNNPRVGDLVYVNFTGKDTPPGQKIGIWKNHHTYVYPPDEGFGENQTIKERAREEIFTIQLLDGSFLKWTNVSLVRIPKNREEYLDCCFGMLEI